VLFGIAILLHRGVDVPAIGSAHPNPIDVIARQTGFADRYRMRRAFLRALG
jgi:hypothetical protein